MQWHVGTWMVVVAVILLGAPAAHADVVTQWNEVACEAVAAAGMGPPPAYRVLALVQTAVDEAVQDAGPRARRGVRRVAVAAAARDVLLATVPASQEAVEAAFRRTKQGVSRAAREEGEAIGEAAAAQILVLRGADGAASSVAYRPRAQAGVYVPTALPAVPHWGNRQPWAMASGDQFRPAPPPALDGAIWARDFEEIRALGSKTSALRTPEQTEIARFWEATLPGIYFGLVRSVADRPGRDVERNARLLAAAAQAMDDALIAVFDAKYHYEFWRPVTAIRNGDLDGNAVTQREAGWTPLVETPMHPEYPCAHCTLAASVGTVLQADAGGDAIPDMSTTSPTLPGVTLHYDSVEAFLQQVAEARILEGVHYRNSTEVGTQLGRSVGALFAPGGAAAP